MILNKYNGLDALAAVSTSSDPRYLGEGFVVTEVVRYFGLGTGEQVVRVVTVGRIEAARHDASLTFLAGNIPIRDTSIVFFGHVGGDDFARLFQSDDWMNLCDEAASTRKTGMGCCVFQLHLAVDRCGAN